MVLVEADVRRRMNGGPLDDVAFMALLARGDLDGVRALYGRFGRPLYAYVNSLVDDEGLAEEVVQDTFVAAWRSAVRFENRSSRQAAVVAA